MEIVRSGRVHYLAPPLDTAAAAVAVMGFSTRHEGVSRPPYNSLNLGTTTDDSPHNIEGNRSILARTFGLTQDRLVTVRQNHGSDILVIDAPNDDLAHFLEIEADAVITNQPGIMIGVTVADCVPLLLLDPVRRVIAAVHAGWQGTAAQITGQVAQGMIRLFGCRPADIRAAIGPCIGPCCYEVDQPVREGFAANAASPWEAVAESSAPGKWRLDMALANRMQLEAAGVAGSFIRTASQCVCCHRELFFSYRRDNGETGRQMGFIMLKES